MKVQKIDHVSIMVQDLEKAHKLFSDLFGEFDGPNESPETDVKNYMSSLGIELVTPLTPDGASAKLLERKGEGFVMLVLQVSNLEEAIAEMESHGVRCVGRSEKTANFHPKDTYNAMIRLIVP